MKVKYIGESETPVKAFGYWFSNGDVAELDDRLAAKALSMADFEEADEKAKPNAKPLPTPAEKAAAEAKKAA